MRKHRAATPAALTAMGIVILMTPVAYLCRAWAQPTGGIYQATVVTTGSDLRFRNAGFAQALREVLVKASGEPRLGQDPRVDKLVQHADQLVAFFAYRDQMEGIHHHDDQGTYDRPFDLTVQFDWLSINAALAQLGEKPWLAARPTVVPVILVRGHDRPYTQHYLISDEQPAAGGQRESLSYYAQKYGIGLRIPSAADLAAWHVQQSDITVPSGSLAGDKFVVLGTLDFRLSTFGWLGVWKATWHGVDYGWGISGVSFDKAFDNLVAGVARIASGHGRPE
jgi:uncharacterized protein